MHSINGIKLKYWKLFWRYQCNSTVERDREPPVATTLRYADTSLPYLLGRPSLNYAVMTMCNT